MTAYQKEFDRWLNAKTLTAEEKEELLSIRDDRELVELRFGAPMSFGTAGLRSTMNLGIACMNRFTVAQTTAGIAALIRGEGGENRGVAIAYDSRNRSKEFAETAACVLADAGIRVFLFDAVRPTPELSFAIRDLGAIAGINITASHNPKEYNGYKAYWEDGAQIAPAQATVVSEASGKIDPLTAAPRISLSDAKAKGLVTMLGEDYDERYLAAVLKTAINPDAVRQVADDLRIVYTPLHGAGHRLVPEILSRIGMKHLVTVPSQMILDGDFPTVKKPNPEYADVFVPGIEIANEIGSDLVIATDPDADRVGVMSRTKDGSFATITGNQMGALLLDYIIGQKKQKGILTPDDYAAKSIVSTDLAAKICRTHGVRLYDVLTGFKFIGEVIYRYEKSGDPGNFLMGFEESYGYLFGSYARDKDAVGAAMMICEMTAYYRAKNMTLSDALDALYETYGAFCEGVLDIYMEGLDGISRRLRVMQSLHDSVPQMLGGKRVVKAVDYLSGMEKDLVSGTEREVSLPKSDVLICTTECGDKIIFRPSGTEPKIKVYFMACAASRKEAEASIAAYTADAKRLTE
jgi:phosphoglucomutase